MTDALYWSPDELRAVLRLEGPTKARTWRRVRKYFAPALRAIPTEFARGHQLYDAAHCRRLIDGQSMVRPPRGAVGAGLRSMLKAAG